MYSDISKLMLFRPESVGLLMRLSVTIEDARGGYRLSACREEVLSFAVELIKLGQELGLEGDLWQCYLTHFLLTNENPYTLGHERAGGEDTLSNLAERDMAVIRGLFRYDFSQLEQALGTDCFTLVRNYVPSPLCRKDDPMGKAVSQMAQALAGAESDREFCALLKEHYSTWGVGDMGHNRFFRLKVEGEKLNIAPVRGGERITLDDLVGYEQQKEELRRNTRAFLVGKGANNVLLYGDSGSGKSTSIKGIVNECFGDGLRLIEIYKHQFKYLAELISTIRNRNYKFVIFIDDLSFEDFEVEYKFLKAVIEGGVEVRPDNVLIYATSNRRHLVKETWNDRSDMTHSGDVHHSDTLEEKLSLASRFGVSINFSSPNRKSYHQIVKTLAEREGVAMEEKELLLKADAWEIRHGGVSGRTARQFIEYLKGC